MRQPLISVIVPTYNRKWLLYRTLNSIISQSYSNIEIVVVNDGREDIKEVLSLVNDYRVRYFETKKHADSAGARNLGLEKAKGEYICFLDDDDIFLRYSLEFRMYMMNKLDAEIVYTRALMDNWKKVDETHFKSIGKNLYWDSPFDKDLILVQNIAPICCPLFSRKAWDNASNYTFDETLETGEDFDFWISLSRKNYFEELKLVDCECSKREDPEQKTGNKNFAISYPIIYKRWRETAENRDEVVAHQNASLKNMGLNPKNYGL